MSRRGTFGMSASLSLGFFVFYWACLKGGENLADRGYFDPWVGMWIANIVLGIIGLYLTVRTARENPTIDWSRTRSVYSKILAFGFSVHRRNRENTRPIYHPAVSYCRFFSDYLPSFSFLLLLI